MQPFFSNNPQDWTAVEGVYVAEQAPPATMPGVNLSAVGVGGEAVRGPVNKMIRVSGEQRFLDVFGGRDFGAGGDVINKLWQAIINKPFGTLWAIRAAAASASAARRDLKSGSTSVLRVSAASVGFWGNSLSVDVQDASDGDSDHFNLVVTYLGQKKTYRNLDVSATGVDNTLRIVGTDDAVWVTLTKLANGRPSNVAAQPLLGGGDGLASDPAAPTVANQGSAGSTTYDYEVVGYTDGGQHTSHSAAGTTGTGNATLNGSNFNRLTWPAVDGVAYYDVYRTVGGASQGKIGRISAGLAASGVMTFDDTGLAGDSASAPSSNTTAAIADADFTGTGKCMEKLASFKGLGVVFLAERSSSALKSKWRTLAGTVSDRIFLVCPDSETVGVDDAITDAATDRTSDRYVYTFNGVYTLDPETATEMLTHPTSWAASDISQSDVDENFGREEAKAFNRGITRLYNDGLTRDDYKALREGGIAALESDNGFAFVSAISVYEPDGTGKEEVTRRRSVDYLQITWAQILKSVVKAKLTQTRKDAAKGSLQTFNNGLIRGERVLAQAVVDVDKLNSQESLGQGIFKVSIQGRLIPHALFVVLVTAVGETVTVQEQ